MYISFMNVSELVKTLTDLTTFLTNHLGTSLLFCGFNQGFVVHFFMQINILCINLLLKLNLHKDVQISVNCFSPYIFLRNIVNLAISACMLCAFAVNSLWHQIIVAFQSHYKITFKIYLTIDLYQLLCMYYSIHNSNQVYIHVHVCLIQLFEMMMIIIINGHSVQCYKIRLPLSYQRTCPQSIISLTCQLGYSLVSSYYPFKYDQFDMGCIGIRIYRH